MTPRELAERIKKNTGWIKPQKGQTVIIKTKQKEQKAR